MVWLRTVHQQNRFRLELVLSKIGILPEMEQLWSGTHSALEGFLLSLDIMIRRLFFFKFVHDTM
ncbi:hypothetical protein Hanom_Chr17g01591501 [Helianthus anomalus]